MNNKILILLLSSLIISQVLSQGPPPCTNPLFPLISLDGLTCVASGNCGVGTTQTAAQCLCAVTTPLVNTAGTGCQTAAQCIAFGGAPNPAGTACTLPGVPPCVNPFFPLISLNGLTCVANGNCGVGTTQTAAQCLCASATPLVNTAGTGCQSPAQCIGSNGFPNAANTLCVSDCTSIGQVLNLFGSGCVANCGNLPLNLARNKCVATCGVNQVPVILGGQLTCQCSANSFLNLLGSACISACPSGSTLVGVATPQCLCNAPTQVISLDLSFCETPAGCANEGGFLDATGFLCVKSCSSVNQFISPTSPTSCVVICPVGSFLNLLGTTCVTTCGPNQISSGGRCVCAANAFQNLASTGCVTTCPIGSTRVTTFLKDICVCDNPLILSNDLTQCITTAVCLASGFPSADATRCVSSCGLINQVLNPDANACLIGCTPPTNFLSVLGIQCVRSCVAFNGFISPDGTKCVTTCNGPLSLDGTQCLGLGARCPGTQIINSQGTQCIASCSLGQVINVAGTQCLNSCIPPTILNVGGTQCVSACPPTTFLNLQGTQCVLNCASLGLVLNANANQCLAACPPTQFLNSAKTQCVVSCLALNQVTSFDGTQCLTTCPPLQIANNNGRCICQVVTSSDGLLCLSICPLGQTNINGRCRNCTSPCATCATSVSTCTSCITNYVINGTTCYKCNSPGQYISNNQCLSCISRCKTCTSANDCQQCTYPFVVNVLGTQCIQNCPTGSLLNSQGTKCVTSCQTSEIIVNGKCQRCQNYCATCRGTTTSCLSCIGGYYLLQSRSTCTRCNTNGFFISGGFCKQCPLYCASCNSQTTCNTCSYGYRLVGGRCQIY